MILILWTVFLIMTFLGMLNVMIYQLYWLLPDMWHIQIVGGCKIMFDDKDKPFDLDITSKNLGIIFRPWSSHVRPKGYLL